MGRPREYDDTTREALVAAASQRLALGGPDAVTLRDVAAAIDATTSAIYSLFGSKTGLLRAVYEAGFAGLARELASVTATDDPRRDLYELAMAYRRSALDRPTLYRVMFAAPEPETGDPLAQDAALSAGTLDRLRDGVARCQSAGVLPGDDPEPLTLQLWALVHGLAMLELRGVLGDDPQARVHWDAALTAIGRGYAAG